MYNIIDEGFYKLLFKIEHHSSNLYSIHTRQKLTQQGQQMALVVIQNMIQIKILILHSYQLYFPVYDSQ